MARLDMRLLAERLGMLREARGWSQTVLAARAGLNLGNVNELEHHRKACVRADTIVALAAALGCTSDYLLGLTPDPAPHPRLPAPARRPRRLAAHADGAALGRATR